MMPGDYRGKTFFVAGTDTDVGKTLIATALLTQAGRSGLRTLGFKPVAAGCDDDTHECNADAVTLRSAATLECEYDDVNPVLLRRAIAPHIAAAEEGIDIRVADLAAHCRTLQRPEVDLLVIEGAGGWMVPLNDTETLADFCAHLGIPVILVVGIRLGCLNHALLTAAAIRTAGLRLAGWVANAVDPDMPALTENIDALVARLPAPLIGRVPYLERGADVTEFLDFEALLNA
jgi:dethiobiotin synthetase